MYRKYQVNVLTVCLPSRATCHSMCGRLRQAAPSIICALCCVVCAQPVYFYLASVYLRNVYMHTIYVYQSAQVRAQAQTASCVGAQVRSIPGIIPPGTRIRVAGELNEIAVRGK